MFRYSYIIIPPLESLGFEQRVREILALLKECGYSGVEVKVKVYRGAGLEDAAPHSLRYLRRLQAGPPAPGGD